MIRHALLALALASCTPLVAAQSTEADLQVRLLHKPLYLLGRWRDDHLKFDDAGKLLSRSDVASFTVSGLDVQSIDLTSKGLTIRGSRVGILFRDDQIQRVILGDGNPSSGKPELLIVQIAPSAKGNYGPVLDAIFTTNLGAFIASLPDYWQSYGAKHLLHPTFNVAMSEDKDGPPLPGERSAPAKLDAGTRRVGGPVSPPKVLSAPEPQYSREARSVQVSGNVLVYMQLDTTGKPTHIRLLRPLGLGLDEKAVEAAERYKFKPALENGAPVPVEMNIEVNFQIY